MGQNQMNNCFFVSDLHGSTDRYHAFFQAVRDEKPSAIFLGGDLLPSGMTAFTKSFKHARKDFVHDFLAVEFGRLREEMENRFPEVFLRIIDYPS